MNFIYDVKEAARLCADGEKIIYVITKENKYSIFLFCFYQIRYKTLNDFKYISYQKDKDIFYYFLKLVSLISFGKYKLTYDA